MGTFLEVGKDKAAKGEGWAPPFISSAQDTVPTAIRLWETYLFTFLTCLKYAAGITNSVDCDQTAQS